MTRHPKRLILFGFLLVLGGAVIPFLMVMRILEPGFFLSFLAYGASIVGFALGLVGIAGLSDRGRH
jgi:hypothetical protein